MAGELQPLDEKFRIVDDYGKPTLYFIKWAQQRQIDISGAVTEDQVAAIIAAYLEDNQLSNVQEILDQISTAHGSILFRGATDWAALAPGVAGQFLKTNGAGADPAWAAGGSGGYGYDAAPVVPDVSGFTLQNAGTASMANAAGGRGIVLTVPTVASNIRFVRKNGAPPATPYTMTVRSRYIEGASGAGIYKSCLILRNSTSGRILIFGDYNSGQHLLQRWSNYTTFSANAMGPNNLWALPVLPWMRVVNNGVSLSFERSPDGDNWSGYATENLATYINAAGGTVDEIGFGIMSNNPGFTNTTLFQSFTAV